MSILSAADPRAAEPEAAYSHKGLTYPFGRRAPAPGETIAIADGVRWGRLPVPGPLKHVNVWLLDDGGDVAVVDTGLDLPHCREAWPTMLGGSRVSRVIVTHFHPDHLGLAGWLAERFAAPLWMSRTEWLYARMLTADVRDTPPREAFAFWQAAGWSADRVDIEAKKGWGRFASVVSTVPVSYIRIADGDLVSTGARAWRVVTGNGHSPEHVCLIDDRGRLMIAGDQVLPKITSNISLGLSEPEGDPLGDWLASIVKLRTLPADLLVLPSHGEPFTGLHARLDALERGHRERLEALHAHLATPRRALDCFAILFGRRIDDDSMGLATGEAMAHLRRLEVEGRATRTIRDDVHWFERG